MQSPAGELCLRWGIKQLDLLSRRMASDLFHDLLHATRTLTIATGGEAGAWCAPVYFLFYRQGFYFFSSATSRHIECASTGCAVSVFCEDGDWRHIRGLQMSGSICAAPHDAGTAVVLEHYLDKFPTVRSLFPDSLGGLEQFSRTSGNRLYCFRPARILLTDNAAGFGSRREIDPGDLHS